MSTFVVLHVALRQESLGAELARELPLPTVDLQVHSQVAQLSEVLVAEVNPAVSHGNNGLANITFVQFQIGLVRRQRSSHQLTGRSQLESCLVQLTKFRKLITV